MENGFRQILNQHYGVNGRCAIRPLGPNVAMFQHMSGPAMIKIHHPLMHPNRSYLETVYHLIDDLQLSPGFIPDLSGRFLGRDGGTVFSVQHFCPGRTLNPGELTALAEPLARLHAGLSRLRHPPIQNHFQRVVTDMKGAIRTYGFQRFERAMDLVEACFETGPRQFIHGDLHPANIIFTDDRVLFIDADSSSYSHAAVDVAFAAFRCGHRQEDEMRAFVNAYNRHADRRVDPACLAPVIIHVILERILFILIERDSGRAQWMDDLDNQLAFLKHAVRDMGPV